MLLSLHLPLQETFCNRGAVLVAPCYELRNLTHRFHHHVGIACCNQRIFLQHADWKKDGYIRHGNPHQQNGGKQVMVFSFFLQGSKHQDFRFFDFLKMTARRNFQSLQATIKQLNRTLANHTTPQRNKHESLSLLKYRRCSTVNRCWGETPRRPPVHSPSLFSIAVPRSPTMPFVYQKIPRACLERRTLF